MAKDARTGVTGESENAPAPLAASARTSEA